MAGCLFLEHLNLCVPDEEAARRFYVDGLGGVVIPKTTNARQLHVNVGSSQFHLLLTPKEGPQLWPGHIELWTSEPLDELHARLQRGGHGSSPEGNEADPQLLVTCPWGNAFVVRAVPERFAVCGSHPGGYGALVAIPRMVHPVVPGAAKVLREYWSSALGCDAELAPMGRGTELVFCVVSFASGQQLVFEEWDDAPVADAYDTLAEAQYHICIYLDASAFEAGFRAAEASRSLYANPRFAQSPPEFGNAMSWEEAAACGQFRVKDLRARPEAAAALALEVEVRSTSHVSCPFQPTDAEADAAPRAAGSGPFAGCSPLPTPPHIKPGFVRIYNGGFGEDAKALAAARRESRDGAGAGAAEGVEAGEAARVGGSDEGQGQGCLVA